MIHSVAQPRLLPSEAVETIVAIQEVALYPQEKLEAPADDMWLVWPAIHRLSPIGYSICFGTSPYSTSSTCLKIFSMMKTNTIE
ncbi:hypothetical protein TELCIR_24761, partial [Teladorsagia circumcincta]